MTATDDGFTDTNYDRPAFKRMLEDIESGHTGGGERLFYRCSRYANNGKSACTMHKIDVEVLETVILHDIQQHANAGYCQEVFAN